MSRTTSNLFCLLGIALWSSCSCHVADLPSAEPARNTLRAVLLSAQHVTEERIKRLQGEPYNAVVLAVDDSAAGLDLDRQAAARVVAAGLDLYYWVEIARHVPTADAAPLRMASLQGHDEWRRLFPSAAPAEPGEVTKVYPWTPILYRENFDGHLVRVTNLLNERPQAKGVFLNDLQAAPSACGCGNIACRWTTDYGPIETAQRMTDDAAAQFVAQLAGRFPAATIIPVWTTECEEHDKQTQCAGIGCYDGLCWKHYAAQLRPLVQEVDLLGVLCLYKDFGQDTPHWKSEAGWIEHALRTFEAPPQNGPSVSTKKLIAVLQGWDVSAEELNAQIHGSTSVGVAGFLVAESRIEQGWEPRIVKLSSGP